MSMLLAGSAARLDPGDGLLRVHRQPARASSTQPDKSLGDTLLGAVEAREEHTRAILDRVGHHLAVAQLEVERGVNEPGRDLQQLGGKVGGARPWAGRNGSRP